MENNNSNPYPVTYSEFLTLINNYQKGIALNDTKSVWFSTEAIQALISQNKANGIRVYFARLDATDPQYPDQDTVLIVATTDQTDPQNPTAENSKDIFDMQKQTTTDYQGSAAGGGTLCPPRCG